MANGSNKAGDGSWDELVRDVRQASRSIAREAVKAAREARDAVRSGEAFHGVGNADDKPDQSEDDNRDASPDSSRSARSRRGPYVEQSLTPSERTYATWIHAAAGLGWAMTFFTGGITFLAPVLITLVMWQARKHDSEFIDDHGREATNFQISILVLALAALLFTVATCGVGVVTLVGLGVLTIVGSVLALRAAHRGEYYRYPVCVRCIQEPSDPADAEAASA